MPVVVVVAQRRFLNKKKLFLAPVVHAPATSKHELLDGSLVAGALEQGASCRCSSRDGDFRFSIDDVVVLSRRSRRHRRRRCCIRCFSRAREHGCWWFIFDTQQALSLIGDARSPLSSSREAWEEGEKNARVDVFFFLERARARKMTSSQFFFFCRRRLPLFSPSFAFLSLSLLCEGSFWSFIHRTRRTTFFFSLSCEKKTAETRDSEKTRARILVLPRSSMERKKETSRQQNFFSSSPIALALALHSLQPK